MIRRICAGAACALVVAAFAWPARGQESDVQKPASAAAAAPADKPRPDFKMAIWYDRADPARTFERQVYDLRKAEYSAEKVDRWLKTMTADYPRYRAYVLDVFLDKVPGETEQDKLTWVSSRELRPFLEAAAAPHRAVIGIHQPPLSRVSPSLSDGERMGRVGQSIVSGLRASTPSMDLRTRSSTLGRPLGAAGGGYGPSRPSYPTPYPYPRPHP